MRPLMLVVLCLAVVCAIGCSSSPPENPSTLSEAAAAADSNKKMKGEKPLHATPAEDDEDDEEEDDGGEPVAPASASAAPPEWYNPEPKEERFVISLVGGGGTLRSSDFDGFGVFGLGIGFMEGRWRGELYGLVMPTNLTEESGVAAALTDEFELALDFRGRFSFTPPHTFAGVYGLAGFRIGELDWSYENTLTVTDDYGDTREVSSDNLNYYAAYVGLGIVPVQVEHFLVSVDVSVGFKMFDDTTSEGFEQDLFKDEIGFGQLLISAGYQF